MINYGILHLQKNSYSAKLEIVKEFNHKHIDIFPVLNNENINDND